MMRTNILSAFLLCFLLTSCYKDLSTQADHEIPDIVITGVPEVLDVVYGEEIHLVAQVSQEGRSGSDFDMSWTVDVVPDSENQGIIELGDGLSLDYKVASNPSNRPYTLRFNVTDRQTGLTKVAICRLFVASSLGEGLLVAYTRDGGKTSEFDLIANQYITYGYDGDQTRFTREIFKLANETSFEGRVNCMAAVMDSDMAAYNESRVMVGTDEHIFAVDPLTFRLRDRDAQLFQSTQQTEFSTTALFNYASYQTGAIVGGRLFVLPTLMDRTFTAAAFIMDPNNIFTTKNTAYAAFQGGHLTVFDEVHSKFYFVIGNFSHQSGFSEVADNNLTFSLKGAKSLAAGESRSKALAFLIQDASGDYHVVSVDASGASAVLVQTDVVIPDIENMRSFAFCDNCDIMYSATDKTLYATLLAAGRVSTRKVNWSPDSPDEKITSIRQYTQAFKGTQNYELDWYDFKLPTNRLQMIITTYNETTGEGKIYLRPFNVSTGLFTSQDNGTYGGFGEITAICPTFR